MQKGDIILIPFPFTDLEGKKLRPALVLVNSKEDSVVCFITSQLKWRGNFDLIITPTYENGIKKESIIKVDKIATIHKKLILGKLGKLSDIELKSVNYQLSKMFQLTE